MAGDWLPLIDYSRCNSCGICIAQCPDQVLGWHEGKLALLNPQDCQYCATCEIVCPCSAIELLYQISFSTELSFRSKTNDIA